MPPSLFSRLFGGGPSEFKLQINTPDLTVTAQAKESLLVAALNEGIAFPYNCRVGGCGECKCRLVSGKVKELTDKSYLLSAEELKQNYILACQSLPKSDVVLEVVLRQGAVNHPIVVTSARIAALTPLTHDILHVQMQAEHPLTYTAGQYAELVVPDEAGAQAGKGRSYSFATAHDAARPNAVDFFIRKVPGGAFTEWLFTKAEVGQWLTLRGPYGDFCLRPSADPIVCIAGGSGLAPIKALLEQAIRDKQANRPLVILFGARTEQDLYGLEAIDQIRRNWTGRFVFEPILSNEAEGSPWKGRRGMITDHLKGILGERLPDYHAYMCGPPPMIDACAEVFTQGGMPSKQIFFDKFLDSGHTAHPAA